MYKVVIIDDEPLARMVVAEYLLAHPSYRVYAECGDGFQGLKAIQEHQPDLIFLDVQMPKLNGFEMLELLEDVPGIIFTTAFDEYAIKAFDANAVDYLMKPFSQERFNKALEKWKLQQAAQMSNLPRAENLTALPGQHERIVVKVNGQVKIIGIQDVLYLEAADDYVKVFTPENNFLKNKTMAFFENTLPPHLFVRVHRSYIVSVKNITRLDPYEKEGYLATLKTGVKVPISKNGYVKLKQVLGI